MKNKKEIVAIGGNRLGKSLLSELYKENAELLDALEDLFDSYKVLADSGDAGFWRLEDTDQGKKAIAAIKKAKKGQK